MTIQLLLVLTSLCLLLFQPPVVRAGWPEKPGASPTEDPFFIREEVVAFTLSLPLDAVLKDRGPTPRFHPATIAYRDTAAATKTMAVQVRVRGNRRKDPAVCRFPPLLVKFSPEPTPGNPFNQAGELKLVTHCLDDTHTLREYLIYKLYNLLTDLSFRVRLCRVTYRDARGRGRPDVHYAYFLESAEAMAQRNRATLVPKQLFIGMKQLDPPPTATMAIFQYMIGNTDWSVPYRHNIRLLSQNVRSAPVPVPYDFDYSGLVMAPYAVPPEQLGLTSVRQRLFRGHDFPPETYAAVRALFNARRAAFYTVYLSSPYLSPDEKLFATTYLNDFYETLNDPKDFERRIGRVGLRNDRRYTHIRGFD